MEIFYFHLNVILSSITSSVMDISHSLRGTVIGNITSGVVDIGLSYGVHKTGAQGMVCEG